MEKNASYYFLDNLFGKQTLDEIWISLDYLFETRKNDKQLIKWIKILDYLYKKYEGNPKMDALVETKHRWYNAQLSKSDHKRIQSFLNR